MAMAVTCIPAERSSRHASPAWRAVFWLFAVLWLVDVPFAREEDAHPAAARAGVLQLPAAAHFAPAAQAVTTAENAAAGPFLHMLEGGSEGDLAQAATAFSASPQQTWQPPHEAAMPDPDHASPYSPRAPPAAV